MRTYFSILYLLIQAVLSRSIDSECDTPTLQQNFDLSKYTGLWYEIARDSEFYWEKDGTCVTAHYAPNKDGSIQVFNSQIILGETQRESASATGVCESTVGQCKVKFFIFWGDYRIVATDYETYAIVYSCKSNFLFSGSNANTWILSRTPTLSDA